MYKKNKINKAILSLSLSVLFLSMMIINSFAAPGGALSGLGGIQKATNSRTSAYEEVVSINRFSSLAGIGTDGFSNVTEKSTDLWEGAEAGTKYWNGSLNQNAGTIWFDLEDPIDNTALDHANLFLSFKIKINDMTKHDYSLIRVLETFDGDGTGYGWWYHDYFGDMKSGQWKELILPVSNPSWKAGISDASGIDEIKRLGFIINNKAGQSCEYSIADVKFVKETIVGDYSFTTKDPEGEAIVIDSCDSLAKQQLWTGGSSAPVGIVLDKPGVEGSAAFSYNLVANDTITSLVFNYEVFGTNLPAENANVDGGAILLDDFKSAFLSFNIFVEDNTKIKPKSLEIALCDTTGVWDNDNNITWIVDETKLNNGWNHVVLPFNSVSGEDNAVDLGYALAMLRGEVGAFNALRINLVPTADTNVKLDNIQFIGSDQVLDKEKDTTTKPGDKTPDTGSNVILPAFLIAGFAFVLIVVSSKKSKIGN